MNEANNINIFGWSKKFPFYGLNWFIYSLQGVFFCFLPFFLSPERSGLSNSQIGILFAVGPVVSVFSPMLWGQVADRAKAKNNVLIFVILASVPFFVGMYFYKSFIWYFVLLAVFMFFFSAFTGLGDTLALEYSQKTNYAYGPMRLMGTLGYGVIALLIGYINDIDISWAFPLYIVVAIITVVVLKLMMPLKGHASKNTKTSILPLFKDKNMVVLIFLYAATQFTFGYYFNFFPTYATEVLKIDSFIWGLNLLLTAWGEIPFFIFYDKILSKFSITNVLRVSLFACVLRYISYYLFPNPFVLLATSFFTGLMQTVILYCLASYVSRYVAPSLRASGQTMLAAVGMWLPRALSTFLGGFGTDIFGVKNIMLILAVFSAAPFLISMFYNVEKNIAPKLIGE